MKSLDKTSHCQKSFKGLIKSIENQSVQKETVQIKNRGLDLQSKGKWDWELWTLLKLIHFFRSMPMADTCLRQVPMWDSL